MEQISQTNIQAKVFDFALLELVRSKRISFQPIWSSESWAKFLIWMALNCGLSGERKILENFAEALGAPLSSRMRRIFFERTLEDLSLHIMADPSEDAVLVMPIEGLGEISLDDVNSAFSLIELNQRIDNDQTLWKCHESVIVVPWRSRK
tara:strand:+ start:444 stop:893 length:450 start_codon:yes stop_codon:yes gene_type:complete